MRELDGDAVYLGDRGELIGGAAEAFGEVGLRGGFVRGCFPFDSGEGEHLADELFHADGVGVALVEAVLVLLDGAGLEGEHLDGGLHDGYGGFEFVGGVADETALLGEGVLEVFEDGLEGAGERAELFGGEDLVGWLEGPRCSGDGGCFGGEFAEWGHASVEKPDHGDAGGGEEKEAGYGVEGHLFEDAVP